MKTINGHAKKTNQGMEDQHDTNKLKTNTKFNEEKSSQAYVIISSLHNYSLSNLFEKHIT